MTAVCRSFVASLKLWFRVGAHPEGLTMSVMTIVTWILRLGVAALFLFAAYMKLSGNPMMIEEFGKVGLGDWFRLFTGVLELVGALLVLYPAFTAWGGVLLLVVDIGAFFAQLLVIKEDVIHCIVIGAVLLVLIYLTRHQLSGRSAAA
jgi:putative oxidoreductase